VVNYLPYRPKAAEVAAVVAMRTQEHPTALFFSLPRSGKKKTASLGSKWILHSTSGSLLGVFLQKLPWWTPSALQPPSSTLFNTAATTATNLNGLVITYQPFPSILSREAKRGEFWSGVPAPGLCDVTLRTTSLQRSFHFLSSLVSSPSSQPRNPLPHNVPPLHLTVT